MYKVFYSFKNRKYYCISRNDAEIMCYDFDNQCVPVFEGTQIECNNFIAEHIEEETLIGMN